jgi:hypothetical protein
MSGKVGSAQSCHYSSLGSNSDISKNSATKAKEWPIHFARQNNIEKQEKHSPGAHVVLGYGSYPSLIISPDG